MKLRFAAFCLSWFAPILPIHAASTIILGDGGNLVAAVAAAQHGDTIELRSNGAFPGTLTWENKHLTIQAGAGFQPILQGNISDIDGNAQSGGTFRGLTLNGGFSASTTGMRFATFNFDNTILNGSLNIGGTGSFHVDLNARDTQFLGGVSLSGTGGFTLDGHFERNTFASSFNTIAIANETVHDIDFFENDFLVRPQFAGGSFSYATRNLVLERNKLRHGITVNVGNYNNVSVELDNNLIGETTVPQSSTEPGILLNAPFTGTYANVNAGFVNNTVVGFNTGIEIRNFVDSTYPPNLVFGFVNMLLHNGDDLLNVPQHAISNSLISDGTFAGVNNNFTALPLLGDMGELLPGSPGIDRGANAFASSLDLAGNPRILDGNGDGLAVVDVGAFELVVPEPATIANFVGLLVAVTLTGRCRLS
jgi:hypothetical protein